MPSHLAEYEDSFTALQEVRLQEIQPSRSYLPAWISKPLQRSRLPSYDSEIGSSALPSPNLANTIHGSLHGASNFADRQWQVEAQAPPARPRSVTPPPSLRVLGDLEGWLSREVGHHMCLGCVPSAKTKSLPDCGCCQSTGIGNRIALSLYRSLVRMTSNTIHFRLCVTAA